MALEAGETHADIYIGNYDDAQMIRIYATENATQRNNHSGVATAAIVASSLKYLIKGILRGDVWFRQICPNPDVAREISPPRKALAGRL